MARAEHMADEGTAPVPYVICCEGLHLETAPGTESGAGEPFPVELSAAVTETLFQLHGREVSGPVMVKVSDICIHGHALGKKGYLVCIFPGADAGAAYRCYAAGLAQLTNGRVQLVTHDRFPGRPLPERVLLQGPVATPQQARDIFVRFKTLVTASLPAKKALFFRLACAELAANTLRHGKHGRMAIYGHEQGLVILAEDRGPGIPLHLLPSSLLVVGYSTVTGSLGAGYPTIIQLSESLTIATGCQGTSILAFLK